jgi:phenylacetate-CoA ligase
MDQARHGSKGLTLRVGLFGGEPWPDGLRKEIEDRLALTATDNYGVSEVRGPGIAGSVICKNGMHLFEDAFLPEIIDPATGRNLPTGSVGELVLTTLSREAFPLIRYRTGDLTSLDYTPCPCGRTSVRMRKPSGRADDMLIIKGVNIFPSQIAEVLFSLAEEDLPHEIVVTRDHALDSLEVRIEITERIFALDLLDQRALLESMKRRFRAVLASKPPSVSLNPGAWPERMALSGSCSTTECPTPREGDNAGKAGEGVALAIAAFATIHPATPQSVNSLTIAFQSVY